MGPLVLGALCALAIVVGAVGGHPDASALRRRYTAAVKQAGLRSLPFHVPGANALAK